ncbi:glycosyltransferase [bacterium]|nr:glycosyltransferase [bacterium]
MRRRPLILLVYPAHSTFVMRDAYFLNMHFEVVHAHVKLSSNPLKLLGILCVFFCRTLWIMPRIQCVYTWFTDYHSPIVSVLAAFFRKSVYTVVGGYEVSNIPELNYGGLKNPIRKAAIKFSLSHADRILAVSEFTAGLTRKLIPGSNVDVVYNGVDLVSEPAKCRSERHGFLCVAHISTVQTYNLKGIPRFIDMARRFPDDTFTLIGVSSQFDIEGLTELPPNLIVDAPVSTDALIEYYASARYYVQLSETESFGIAILEAMAQGGLPIIANRGAMPEIFSGCAIVVDWNAQSWETALHKLPDRLAAFELDEAKVAELLERYSLKRRYTELEQILASEIDCRRQCAG